MRIKKSVTLIIVSVLICLVAADLSFLIYFSTEDLIKDKTIISNTINTTEKIIPVINEIPTQEDKVVRKKLTSTDYYTFMSNRNPNLSDKDIEFIYNVAEYYCKIREVPLDFFMSMGSEESGFDKYADSFLGPSNGRGIWQVSEAALNDFNDKYAWKFNKFYTPSDLYDVKINVEVATWAYKRNFIYGDIESEDNECAVIAYNVGAGYYKDNKYDLTVNKKYKGRDYKHLDKVLKSYNILYKIN